MIGKSMNTLKQVETLMKYLSERHMLTINEPDVNLGRRETLVTP